MRKEREINNEERELEDKDKKYFSPGTGKPIVMLSLIVSGGMPN